jgi:hypothetical protein
VVGVFVATTLADALLPLQAWGMIGVMHITVVQ